MIKAYSQRLSPPFSGQVQVAESERARAVTMDGRHWEIHFMHGTRAPGQRKPTFARVANIRQSSLAQVAAEGRHEGQAIDERIIELAAFLAEASMPFPVADRYECWLLDPKDERPLALIYTCLDAQTMQAFPTDPEWTSLPASVMPIERSEDELSRGTPPVNYQIENLVDERAGYRKRVQWFCREAGDQANFPPLLLREDWEDEQASALCQRYLQRQAPRLLMLHGLAQDKRLELEQAASAHASEVGRFYAMYPEVADQDLMSRIRVEARMREVGAAADPAVPTRTPHRDGILYI